MRAYMHAYIHAWTRVRMCTYMHAHTQVVPPPKIDVGRYHLFLSHVWATGQDQMRIVKERLREMVPCA